MQWGIESIAAAAAQSESSALGATLSAEMQGGLTQTSAPGAFANLMQGWITDVNASAGVAETAMRDLAAGKAVELHEVMINLEHARISVQTFVQVRNKLVESYQDLMRMQL